MPNRGEDSGETLKTLISWARWLRTLGINDGGRGFVTGAAAKGSGDGYVCATHTQRQTPRQRSRRLPTISHLSLGYYSISSPFNVLST